jgi:hypothetical protein
LLFLFFYCSKTLYLLYRKLNKSKFMCKIHRSVLFISLLLGLIVTSCKKKETTPTTPVTQSDQSGSSAADAAIDDVNDFINNSIGGGSNQNTTARIAAYNLPCGIIRVDSSGTARKLYTLNYGNQTPCGYQKKGGQVSFQLVSGSRYDSAGAVFSITYINYTLEGEANGDIVTLNGTLYFTNISGGYVWQSVVQSKTIQHSVRGAFTVTYANNEMRQRNYYQRRTWSSTGGWAGLNFTVAGDTTIDNIKISEIGKTYDGNYDYQTQMLTAFSWSNCGTTYAGPYVLKNGDAKLNVIVPGISVAYFEVQAGYFDNTADASSTPTAVSDCTSNAYKITSTIGTTTTTQFQLY